jgi:hypothetical protein
MLVDDGRMHVDAPAIGEQPPHVERLALRRRHAHGHVGRAGVHELDALPSREDDLAPRGVDHAGIRHARGRADQRDTAAQRGAQFALVDDAARGSARQREEGVAAGQPVVVVDVQRRRHEAGHVHAGALAEQHAIGIEQPDLPVAGEAAEDAGRIVPGHPVEHLARRAGLGEVHAVLAADGERLPVQDRVVGVDDRHLAACRGHVRRATDDLGTARQGLRLQSVDGGQRQQRRAPQRQGQAVRHRGAAGAHGGTELAARRSRQCLDASMGHGVLLGKVALRGLTGRS